MKIHLDEKELKTIIQDYLTNQMPELSRREFDIQLIAGRGDNGHRAEVEIFPALQEEKTEVSSDPIAEQPAVTPFNFGDTEDSSSED